MMRVLSLKQRFRDFVSCLVFVSLIYVAIVQFIFNEPRLDYFHWALLASVVYTLVRGFIDYCNHHKHPHR